MANPKPFNPSNDVTEKSGYTFEDKLDKRTSNGYGGTQTKLPVGHLARRDSPAVVEGSKAEESSPGETDD